MEGVARSASRLGLILWILAWAGPFAAALAADPPEYEVVGDTIPHSLTGGTGDPDRGELIVRDADNATCLICHEVPIAGEPDPGDIGPPLAGAGSRYTAGELRLRLVEPKLLNPDTVMPSYYRQGGLHRVADEYRDAPIYTAQEIEDVIAYLLTLRDD